MHLLADKVIKCTLEDALQDDFFNLEAGDIVFIDNSHRSFRASDVTVFFIEILPLLKKGVVIGIHDVFLPFDYPTEWKDRFYNEQYLLAAYLLGGADGGRIVFPVHYVTRFHSEICARAFPALSAQGVVTTGGGAFFFER